ncbi:MAG: hypothetical protein OXG58_07185 [Gemmatimonadetes bacterium]|nr:hypothetical protein [Gemmatimonadota bacterium]MCY3943904.1 hypothetical protein [Gemmatimonadota bacterium]
MILSDRGGIGPYASFRRSHSDLFSGTLFMRSLVDCAIAWADSALGSPIHR